MASKVARVTMDMPLRGGYAIAGQSLAAQLGLGSTPAVGRFFMAGETVPKIAELLWSANAKLNQNLIYLHLDFSLKRLLK